MIKQTYFFIGINGIGMSGLAEILAKKGHCVMGSDISESLNTDYFNALGIRVFNAQEEKNVEHSDWVVVVSSAIKQDNQELIKAKTLGCQIIKRGTLLSSIGKTFDERIAVIGTHGKTTTTSLIIRIFSELSPSPSYFVGGHLPGQSHVGLDSKQTFITELDESDGSFLEFSPSNTIITNIEHDHVDFYQTKKDVVDAFITFVDQTIENGGECVINIDDPLSEKIYKQHANSDMFLTYAIENKHAKVRAENIEYTWQGTSFKLMINDNTIEDVTLNLFGRHNIYNALSAISLAISKGILLKHILVALKTFSGVKRRLELKYTSNNIMLFDDYAHHPTEILTTLEGIYKSHPKHRIITIFQPHRYSRLTNLFDEFSKSFIRSNEIIVLPVFAAGETSNGYKTSKDLATSICGNSGNVTYCDAFEVAYERLTDMVQSNDIIILMGAGNVTAMSKSVINIIKQAG